MLSFVGICGGSCTSLLARGTARGDECRERCVGHHRWRGGTGCSSSRGPTDRHHASLAHLREGRDVMIDSDQGRWGRAQYMGNATQRVTMHIVDRSLVK